MDLQIPMNYMYGLTPHDMHKELDSLIASTKKDPVRAYLQYNEHVAKLISTGLGKMEPVEIGLMFYIWAVLCSAAAHDPAIIAASEAVRELANIKHEMKHKVEKEFEERFDAIKEKIVSKKCGEKSIEPKDTDNKIIFGAFGKNKPESVH